MTQAEFFARAQVDPTFRATKIEEWTYLRNVCVGLGIAQAVIWLGYGAYVLIAQQRAPAIDSALLGAVLTTALFAQATTRLASLRAIGVASAK